MDAILDNLRVFAPITAGVWLVFFASVIIWPQRFRNAIMLMIALFFSTFFIASFFGEYIKWALLVIAILFILALLLVPVMLIINGIVMMKRESKSLGNILSLILGVLIAIGEIAVFAYLFLNITDIQGIRINGPLYFVGSSVFYFSCWILTYVLYMIFIQLMPHRRNFDYIVIHGSGLINGSKMSKLLSNRVDKAIQIYNRCRVKPIIIPSGGQGSNEDISEAVAMKEYLLEKGIPEDHIILEDRSKTTMENLKFSKEIIDSREGKKKTALISSNYHIYRCMLFASKLNFKCRGIGAKVAAYYWPSATLREFVAVFSKPPFIFWILAGFLIFSVLPLTI